MTPRLGSLVTQTPTEEMGMFRKNNTTGSRPGVVVQGMAAGPSETSAICQAMQETWSAAYDGEAFEEPLRALNQTVQRPVELNKSVLTGNQTTTSQLTLDDVEVHMANCSSCVAVTQSAEHFRRLRVRAAETSTFDFRPAIRATIAKDHPDTTTQSGSLRTPLLYQGRREGMTPSILITLLVTGIAQALGALPDLFGSVSGGSFSTVLTGVEHLTREAAASEIALAAGFVYVAVKPLALPAVRMFASVLTTLVIFSTLTSGSVVNDGLPLEMHHLITLFGTALLWLLPNRLRAQSPFSTSTPLPKAKRTPFSRSSLPG